MEVRAFCSAGCVLAYLSVQGHSTKAGEDESGVESPEWCVRVCVFCLLRALDGGPAFSLPACALASVDAKINH